MPTEQTVLRWSAYEHEFIEREGDWFIALGIAAACLAVVSILFHDVLFAIVIIAAGVAIGVHARVVPELTEFEISERGVRVDGVLHRYHEILAFWVEDETYRERPLLMIDTTKIMSPNIIIPIEHIDPRLVRAYLIEHVPEMHMKEPIAHQILEFLGL